MDIVTTWGPGIALLLAAMSLTVLLVLAWWFWRWAHTPPRELNRLLRAHAHSVLADVVIPDGVDGYIHLDYLLLTPTGLRVVDTLNVQGVVFGAPRMDEWTVMQGHKRHSFRNPLYGLQDRVAAVRSLAIDVEVEGAVVFCRGAHFPKGLPEGTLEYHDLSSLKSDAAVADNLLDAWKKIEVAVRSPQ